MQYCKFTLYVGLISNKLLGIENKMSVSVQVLDVIDRAQLLENALDLARYRVHAKTVV